MSSGDRTGGSTQRLAALRDPRWLEWSRGGVVVHDTLGAARHALIYARPGRAPRRVGLFERLSRFTAAARAPRAIAFTRRAIYAIDLARGGAPQRLAGLRGPVINAEISPDGRHLAYVSAGRGVYLLTGAGQPRQLDGRGAARSLWFSADGGRLVFADTRHAVALDLSSERRYTYRPSAGALIRTLRLRRDDPGEVLIVTSERVIGWDPASARSHTLARRSNPRARIESAETFGRGVALLTSRPSWSHRRPRPRRRRALRRPLLANPAPRRKRVPFHPVRQQQQPNPALL